MIKAYLFAIPSLYEDECIEMGYSLFRDDVHIKAEAIQADYAKPAVVGLVSVLILLQKMEEYKAEEITVFINDPALYEIIKGTSTTQNWEIKKMATKTKKKLERFANVSFVNVTKNKEALAKWKSAVEV